MPFAVQKGEDRQSQEKLKEVKTINKKLVLIIYYFKKR